MRYSANRIAGCPAYFYILFNFCPSFFRPPCLSTSGGTSLECVATLKLLKLRLVTQHIQVYYFFFFSYLFCRLLATGV